MDTRTPQARVGASIFEPPFERAPTFDSAEERLTRTRPLQVDPPIFHDCRAPLLDNGAPCDYLGFGTI